MISNFHETRPTWFQMHVHMICHMKIHMVSYNFSQKKFKSTIHVLPIYGQMDLKKAIVVGRDRDIWPSEGPEMKYAICKTLKYVVLFFFYLNMYCRILNICHILSCTCQSKLEFNCNTKTMKNLLLKHILRPNRFLNSNTCLHCNIA